MVRPDMTALFSRETAPQPQLPGTFEQAVWTQYCYCLNAMNASESESVSVSGISSFQSHPSFLRFEGQVHVLKAMILPEWEDDKYREELASDVFTRKVDSFGKLCYHSHGFYGSCNCEDRKFTEEKGPLEVFRSITLLMHRKKIFPVGDKVSLLP